MKKEYKVIKGKESQIQRLKTVSFSWGKRKRHVEKLFIKRHCTISAIRDLECFTAKGKIPPLVPTKSPLNQKIFRDEFNVHAPLIHKTIKPLPRFLKAFKSEYKFNPDKPKFVAWYDKNIESDDLIKSYSITTALMSQGNTISFCINIPESMLLSATKQASESIPDYLAGKYIEIFAAHNIQAWFVVESKIDKQFEDDMTPDTGRPHIHGVMQVNPNNLPKLKEQLLSMYPDRKFKKKALDFKDIHAPFGMSEYAFKEAARTLIHLGSFKLHTTRKNLLNDAREAYNSIVLPGLKNISKARAFAETIDEIAEPESPTELAPEVEMDKIESFSMTKILEEKEDLDERLFDNW